MFILWNVVNRLLQMLRECARHVDLRAPQLLRNLGVNRYEVGVGVESE